MIKYIKHVVVDVGNSQVQNCIICGENICDYTNVMYPHGQATPKCYAAGNIFIGKGNPTITTTVEPKEGFENCKR